MVNYHYKCNTCEKEFEVQQSITENRYKYCTEKTCQNNTPGKGLVERVIYTNGFILNSDSGFHKTDYKK